MVSLPAMELQGLESDAKYVEASELALTLRQRIELK